MVGNRGGDVVVVVEDDDSMSSAIERLLGLAGIPCRTYASAEALLEAFATKRPDCVVSDMKLPAMTGLDLLAELRNRGERTPLILITGHDSPELRARALREGVTDYLAKPFAGADLLEAVRAAIAA
jgi:FixJ family two-component response regulator